jgi:hypothetical protein
VDLGLVLLRWWWRWWWHLVVVLITITSRLWGTSAGYFVRNVAMIFTMGFSLTVVLPGGVPFPAVFTRHLSRHLSGQFSGQFSGHLSRILFRRPVKLL